jgi:ATP-binding protein involved in chromosome partitioning
MSLPMYKKTDSHPLGGVKKVIAIAAGKGGVGKSTVAVNLALALQYKGYRVGLMDCDIYGPSIRKMLPEERPPSQIGQKIIPAVCQGIRMISMAYFRKLGEAAAVRAPIANSIIAQFVQNVEWGELDYLLLDFPPGTGDIQLSLCQNANIIGAVMVTTPQEVAVMDVWRAMDLFEQVKIPILGIVENMSYYQGDTEKVYLFGKGGGERLAVQSGVPLLGSIPIAAEISLSGDAGKPLLIPGEPHVGTCGSAFLNIADGVIAEVDLLSSMAPGVLQQFEIAWKEMNI